MALRIRSLEVDVIDRREYRLGVISARRLPGIAGVFDVDRVSEVIEYLNGLLAAIVSERRRIGPYYLRQLEVGLADRPRAAVYLRNFVIVGIVRDENGVGRILACLHVSVAAVFNIDSLRDVSEVYAVLPAVIDERVGIIPEYIRDIYPLLHYPPLTVRRSDRDEIVLIVFEHRVGVVDARVIRSGVLVLGVYAFRQAFELYSLDLAVVGERAAVVPLYAGHVEFLLVDLPLESHVLRRVEVMHIRIDERSPGQVFAGIPALVAAVFDFELRRERHEAHAADIAVIYEFRSFAPSCAGHVVRSFRNLPLVLSASDEAVIAVQ